MSIFKHNVIKVQQLIASFLIIIGNLSTLFLARQSFSAIFYCLYKSGIPTPNYLTLLNLKDIRLSNLAL
jgi:hypothetical protein